MLDIPVFQDFFSTLIWSLSFQKGIWEASFSNQSRVRMLGGLWILGMFFFLNSRKATRDSNTKSLGPLICYETFWSCRKLESPVWADESKSDNLDVEANSTRYFILVRTMKRDPNSSNSKVIFFLWTRFSGRLDDEAHSTWTIFAAFSQRYMVLSCLVKVVRYLLWWLLQFKTSSPRLIHQRLKTPVNHW